MAAVRQTAVGGQLSDSVTLGEMNTANIRPRNPRGLIYDLIYPFKSIGRYLGVAAGVSLLLNVFVWPESFGAVYTCIIAVLWSMTHWVVQSIGNGLVIYNIDRRISWLERPWSRAVIGFVSLVLFSAPAFLVVQLTFVYLYSGALPEPLWEYVVFNARFAVVISFVVSFILTSVSFLKKWRSSSMEAQRLKAEMMTYKYESLRNQINPHFLFNSLNTLSDLVYEDQEVAVKFIRQMSDLYRYVLDSREREVVPLQEEMDFIDSFAFLLSTRFEDKLHIEIDVQAESDELIVPMALQGLVENAVKHNEVSTRHPLTVRIYKEADHIMVSNPLQKKRGEEGRAGSGLTNIKARYAYLSQREVSVTETADSFEVSLPILRSADR